jgi:hypothetical protein
MVSAVVFTDTAEEPPVMYPKGENNLSLMVLYDGEQLDAL